MLLDTELEECLTRCYSSIGEFGRTLMPERFFATFTELHHAIYRAIDSPHQKEVIAAPRGIGKTTTVCAEAMRKILFRDANFILYVSNAENVAELQTENIKRELLTNDEIRKLFGDISVSDSPEGFNETFSKRAWVAYGNTLVLPRGAGQQVRGLLYKRYRPDIIIIDDLEVRDQLSNAELRRKLKDWFHSDLEKCIDRYSNKWKLIYIDTLKHEDSLLAELLSSADWHATRLELFNDDYVSNVPELISTDEIRRDADIARENGTLDIMFMEYRNIPTARENASFRQEDFHHFDSIDIDTSRIENLMIIDPAKTVQMQNADSAIVGVGVDYATGRIYVRDIVYGKMFPNQLYDEMFAMRRRLRAHAIGIEVTGLEEFIKQPILNEMQKRGPNDAFEPVWLKARGGSADERGKLARIGALVPYYRQGYIWHNRSCCDVLESQLLAFPRGRRVDVADALAYVIEMLEIGERYFNAPGDERSEDEELDGEFLDLDYEPALDDSWRRI